ncbi:putative TetR-family transcriptional regulator [Streptomyces himastatinicus ATCC 53653]|uniref:Putative TetR-family transcriptional regulator n=1 Tax=Streptomyces himastatinicus ATCC 53653 TaxID=457427 RepID=D9W601_9ACTN|nr:helix-turn-helix domain-containing protein [Streptomyces himastatinicus]EFL20356.1 putative TetR-family transcriptional regulator [Streptomyces himastatinicus ATCC 53653]
MSYPWSPGRSTAPRKAAGKSGRGAIRLILRTARTVFADRGYEVSIEKIARRSGVGMGTIYRHFPSKSALVEHVAVGVMAQASAEIERASEEEPDTWAAFTRVLRHMAQHRSGQMNGISYGWLTTNPDRLAEWAGVPTS